MSETDDLLDDLGRFAYDPLGFVLWAFPWGEANTELREESGPDEWQTWVLENIRKGLLTPEQAIRLAIASGHGIGKSALVAWIVWWAYATFPGTRGVVTANTENQLKTKTWVEIAKWHRLFIAKHLFHCRATAIFSVDEEMAREWRIDIVPWSENNVEAFAGLHNAGKRLLIVFDEASAIPDLIHETTEGALTDKDTEIIWCMFGNPTRNVGRFREAFEGGKFCHRWITREVDSRTVKRTNKTLLEEWVQDYGLDSDFVRVRILGKFPKSDAKSFISPDSAMQATKRQVEIDPDTSIVLGVDVARFGDDISVIWPRKGRDARSIPIKFFQGIDTQALAREVFKAFYELNAEAVFIDGTGVGGGVVDTCRAMGLPVYEVVFSAKPDGFDTSAKYMNKRAEIWGMMREFLKTGAIPERVGGRNLIDELCGPTYAINARDLIQLESKELMKSRGVASPDFADALACTFAFPFAEVKTQLGKTFLPDPNPFSEESIYEQT